MQCLSRAMHISAATTMASRVTFSSSGPQGRPAPPAMPMENRIAEAEALGAQGKTHEAMALLADIAKAHAQRHGTAWCPPWADQKPADVTSLQRAAASTLAATADIVAKDAAARGTSSSPHLAHKLCAAENRVLRCMFTTVPSDLGCMTLLLKLRSDGAWRPLEHWYASLASAQRRGFGRSAAFILKSVLEAMEDGDAALPSSTSPDDLRSDLVNHICSACCRAARHGDAAFLQAILGSARMRDAGKVGGWWAAAVSAAVESHAPDCVAYLLSLRPTLANVEDAGPEVWQDWFDVAAGACDLHTMCALMDHKRHAPVPHIRPDADNNAALWNAVRRQDAEVVAWLCALPSLVHRPDPCARNGRILALAVWLGGADVLLALLRAAPAPAADGKDVVTLALRYGALQAATTGNAPMLQRLLSLPGPHLDALAQVLPPAARIAHRTHGPDAPITRILASPTLVPWTRDAGTATEEDDAKALEACAHGLYAPSAGGMHAAADP